MKKNYLPSLFLLLATGLFAQQTKMVTAEKNAIFLDPTQVVQQAPADQIAPQITCINGISINIMPTGAITLWASDFLQSVTDNETPVDQIKIGLRKCGTGTGFPNDLSGNPISSIQFDCVELGTQCVELWAEDADGNTNYCETYTVVLDNLGNCNGSGGNWLIEICAKTETADGIEELEIEVTGTNPNGPFYANEVPDPFPFSGCTYFDVPLGSDVTAKPVKDDNYLNGVTTYDKVLIARHIEGIEPFNSPYKLIAADVDRNGLIDSMDILEIEKLILGIYTEFPNNTSWRFVDKSYTFPDPNNPFLQAFPESITVQNIQAVVSADFVGIKIGDVNFTAVANLLEPVIDERKTQKDDLDLQLERPSPNPTDQSARLSVTLPIAEDVQMVLSDATGRLCWTQKVQLDKGRHTLEIPATAMPTSGIYIWQIKVGGMVEAGKLLRL